jgi:hypothetical protein
MMTENVIVRLDGTRADDARLVTTDRNRTADRRFFRCNAA